jgi:hypothetical protein
MQQTTTTDRISIYITYIRTDISKHNINKKHTQTEHTSMVKYLPRRQHHVWIPPKVHPSIGVPKYDLRHLSPYLRHLCRKIMATFATTVANQNCRPLPQVAALVPQAPLIEPSGVASAEPKVSIFQTVFSHGISVPPPTS